MNTSDLHRDGASDTEQPAGDIQEQQSASDVSPEPKPEPPLEGGAQSEQDLSPEPASESGVGPLPEIPPEPSSEPSSLPTSGGASENVSESPSPGTRPFPPSWALLLLLLGLIIVAVVGVGVLRQTLLAPDIEEGAEPAVVEKLATFDSPPELPDEPSVLQENGAPLMGALPSSLAVKDRTYTVVPVPPEDGRWPVPADNGDKAVWVYGTVVNYVIGVPYTETTSSMLSALEANDHLTLTLANGTHLIFGTPETGRFAVDDKTPLQQRQPGLTLVQLGGGGEDRLVVQARYLPEESPLEASAQRVGPLAIAVLDSALIGENEGERSFVVEYEIENRSEEALDPALFELVLEDGRGQRYAIVPQISEQGNYGALPAAPVDAGATVQASAGYRVPEDLEPPLTWIFRVDPTAGLSARFSLPYRPPLPGPPQPQVVLEEAFADGGRGTVVVGGVVKNVGESPLVVLEENVKLSSSAGRAELRAESPPLPWEISAGGEQAFELQFERPTGVDTVLLDIWGFTFEISGLP